MKRTCNDIEELMNKFFEGETSKDEEGLLYEYFDSGEFPEHLAEYAGLFASFKNDLDDIPRPLERLPPVSREKTKMSRIPYMIAGLAASVAIAAALLTPGLRTQRTTSNPYEGSYMIMKGKKITDMDVLMPEIEKTVNLTSEIKREIDIMNQELFLQMHIQSYLNSADL